MPIPGRVAALAAVLAVGVIAPCPGAGVATAAYRPNTQETTTLAKAQQVAPFLVRYPTRVPAGAYLRFIQVSFPPSAHDPRGIMVNLYYGPNRHFVLVTDVWGHSGIIGGGVDRSRIDGRPAAIQVLRRRGASTVYTIALYFPHSTCLLMAQAIQMTLRSLEAMAASVRAS